MNKLAETPENNFYKPVQSDSFGSTCIPLTMEIAVIMRDYISPKLEGLPSEWSFPDKVLVWLAPSLLGEIQSYYESTHSRHMRELFQPHQIVHFDYTLLSILLIQLEKIKPGICKDIRKS